ncbi:hypothetical protein, partial [Burkholderia pseudomallei]|uniref:hypothetical protein n=1 Tax=Burkholderia pseudomallei TaxID=28450 RepID=UPI0011AF2FF2
MAKFECVIVLVLRKRGAVCAFMGDVRPAAAEGAAAMLPCARAGTGRFEAPGSGARARQHSRGALRRRRPHVAHECAHRTALAQHEYNHTFKLGHERLVPTMKPGSTNLLYPFNPLGLPTDEQQNPHFEQSASTRR